MKRINSTYCIIVIIITQITVMIPMGLNLTLLNSATPALKTFINQTHYERYGLPATDEYLELMIVLAQTILVIGSLVGSFLYHWAVTIFSRKTNVILVQFVGVISALVMGPVAKFVKSHEVLILGRFLNGVSRGVGMSLIPLIVAETTNRELLPFYQSPTGCLIQIGAALGNGFGHPAVLGGVNTWPYLMLTAGMFQFLYICVAAWMPQTPPYLILKQDLPKERLDHENNEYVDQHSGSIALLRKLRNGSNSSVLEEHRSICAEICADLSIRKATVCEMISMSLYRKQLIAATVTFGALQMTGMQGVFQYSNNIFIAAGVKEEDSAFISIGMFVAMAFTTAVSIKLLQSFGSRKMLMVGNSIASCSNILLVISTVKSATVPGMAYVSVAAVIIFIVGVASGPMLSMASLPAELTTQITRPTALWVAYVYYLVPNTHRKSVSEIQLKFKSRGNSTNELTIVNTNAM
uniref:solute carrier family 2, facilitated glucose transporter member 7-like n=1 Tax=Ciona intestinalis TaxID=7719 RepID=UPI0002B8D4B5|nr:solute carrier family 2, facilitated glucose transporter member 7-like [Ciona intestinalis]|eukprot:XP_026691171.1 solute carrier family 2, facilitated glucose transporter member 7-like [Ciona intestinalis]